MEYAIKKDSVKNYFLDQTLIILNMKVLKFLNIYIKN